MYNNNQSDKVSVTFGIFLMVINSLKISSNNYNQSTISMRETRTLACIYKKENRFLGVFLDGRTEDPGCLMTVLYTDMTLTIDLAAGYLDANDLSYEKINLPAKLSDNINNTIIKGLYNFGS